MIFRLFIRTIIVLSALLGLKAEAATLELLSPSGKIKVAVQTDKEISYSVSFGGKELLRQNAWEECQTTIGQLKHCK